ncbi:hypothetical protein [Paenarthrobacter nitroguajacolicus]
MSNLGVYQTVTTVIKVVSNVVGGPGKAVALVTAGIGATGYGVFRGVEAGGKAIYRTVTKLRATPDPLVGQLFTIAAEADAGRGLTLRAGDEIRVLERDGDAVLVEVLGDADSPYSVSGWLLASISDFPGGEPIGPTP